MTSSQLPAMTKAADLNKSAQPTPGTVIELADHSRWQPVQTVLDLTFTVGDGVPAQPRLPRRLFVIETAEEFCRQPTDRDDLPPAERWAATMAIAVVEVLHGQRPISQLVRWMTHDVLTRLHDSALARQRSPQPIPRRSTGPARVPRIGRYSITSLRVTEPADGVVEAAALLTGPGRPIALAMRFEGYDGRWLCTVLDSADRGITGTQPGDSERALEA
ncbi:MAG TPA: hypothetical protein DCM51_00350 [Actinobacteria bacterium]|nr:hypothetical protein [Actinomycetota bacterium]